MELNIKMFDITQQLFDKYKNEIRFEFELVDNNIFSIINLNDNLKKIVNCFKLEYSVNSLDEIIEILNINYKNEKIYVANILQILSDTGDAATTTSNVILYIYIDNINTKYDIYGTDESDIDSSNLNLF